MRSDAYERPLDTDTGDGRARVLASYIKAMPGLKFVRFNVPYDHMGATLVDGVLQAGVRYETVVVPRVERIKTEHPEAVTTSHFAELLGATDPHELLQWKREASIETLQDLMHLVHGLGLEDEGDLLAWLDQPGSKARVTAIKGIGEKTFQYLRFLAGADDAVAIDRWLWRVLEDAKVSVSGFDDALTVFRDASAVLRLPPATLEYSVWRHMSRQSRRRRIMRRSGPAADPLVLEQVAGIMGMRKNGAMAEPASDHGFPRGWDDSRWDTAKNEIGAIIWSRGLLDEPEPITYMHLTEKLDESVYVHHQSKWLALLLNEIVQDVRDEEGPWVTAFVVRSGSTCPGEGFFTLVPEDLWRGMGKTAFCTEQRRLSVKWIRDHPEAWRRSGHGQMQLSSIR